MAAKLSHEPGPLGSQESQHELQEPQELSGSKHDPNEPESNQLEINMLRLVQAQCNAPYNLGSPPYSRHDPEAAPYIKPKLNTAPYSLGSPHDSRHDPEAALYTTSAARPTAGTTLRPRSTTNANNNLGSPPNSRHDPEAALYNLGSPPRQPARPRGRALQHQQAEAQHLARQRGHRPELST